MRKAIAEVQLEEDVTTRTSTVRSRRQGISYLMDHHPGSKAAMEELGLEDAYSLCLKHKGGNICRHFGAPARSSFYGLCAVARRDEGEKRLSGLVKVKPLRTSKSPT